MDVDRITNPAERSAGVHECDAAGDQVGPFGREERGAQQAIVLHMRDQLDEPLRLPCSFALPLSFILKVATLISSP